MAKKTTDSTDLQAAVQSAPDNDGGSSAMIRAEISSKEIAQDNESKSDNDDAKAAKESKQRSNARWALLRNAIVKNASSKEGYTSSKIRDTSMTHSGAAEGSIHQFPGFNLLPRGRIPRSKVPEMVNLLTRPIVLEDTTNQEEDLVVKLELSLLALSALRSDKWIWEFLIQFQCKLNIQKVLERLDQRLQRSSDNPKLRIRLGKGSGWIDAEKSPDVFSETTNTCLTLKIVLAPFFPSCGIFCYSLPLFDDRKQDDTKDKDDNSTLLLTRERLGTTKTSLQELVSHHHHDGIDNTSNVCVWDCEKTLAYTLMKHLALQQPLPWWNHDDDNNNPLHILELGAGMAGLAGLSLAQTLQQRNPKKQLRLWLTDGHPQAAKNNQVHAHLMQLRFPNNAPVVKCLVLPWSMDPPREEERIPPCHVALVSDCTHFQEYHGHLLLTLVYGVAIHGCIYMCQPNRGNSLVRFLNVVRATGSAEPLLSLEWIEIPEIENDTESPTTHYDPSIHRPRLLLLRKLRAVEEADRELVRKHMSTRDDT
ncbi:Calmodulin-lysine N-methyltransferase [Seminavis robusta]|uniref:Calmodulin-lysine N-methyltransferase n=1 Tax=Seminavis robusta TaxID=568900 RepID=A0A9N8DT90_9STRA|nr:Calmodulin-lysine N-methyltransferase [Seminavis robusta]|eukprot:Sro335_g119980.1 Calmodulin-lysine N-methyltransferase (535) ;mRNA; f:8983-10587